MYLRVSDHAPSACVVVPRDDGTSGFLRRRCHRGRRCRPFERFPEEFYVGCEGVYDIVAAQIVSGTIGGAALALGEGQIPRACGLRWDLLARLHVLRCLLLQGAMVCCA